jgi:hypothetical protein
METLGMKSDYILEASLKDLYSQCNFWLSEIALWNIELAFFRKLIRKYGVELDTKQDKDEIENYTELNDYYKNRLLREVKEKVEAQNRELYVLMRDSKSQNENDFRDKQKDLLKIIGTFEIEFKNFKKEFLTFIEKELK